MHKYFLGLLVACTMHGNNFKTLFDEGVEAFHQQEYTQATSCFEHANRLQPNNTILLFNLAVCYKQLSKNEEAINLLYKVIEFDPSYIKAYHQLIPLLKEKNDEKELEKFYKQLLVIEPNNTQAHLHLARHYKEIEQFDVAINHFEQVLEIEPHNNTCRFELAIANTMIGQTQRAIELYDQLLEVNPNNISMIYNKGYVYKMGGNATKAIEMYKQTLEINPNYDSSHFALGHAYLIKGDYAQGWKQHARYLKQAGRNGDKLRQFLAEGTTEGKRILLRPEGGLGDSIHFVRYARELKRYGIYVIVAVPKSLYDLLKNCSYIDELVKIGDPIPSFHDHTTLMSIPAILYSHEQRLPDFSPYLQPDPERITYWGDYLKHDTNFKIGICWEASVYNDSSRPPVARRGMPLEIMYILSELEGVSLYSLQQHDGVEQLKSIPPYFNIHIFNEEFDKTHGSFVDTAAVMHHMDFIISVDTAIAHLAGAMAKPIWLLLPWATDWRWLEHQTSSPWYPTMRIFKQPEPFDWKTVLDNVYLALLKKLHY